MFACDMVVCPFAGVAMDRWGRRYPGIASPLVMLLGYTVLALAPTRATFFLAIAIVGAGHGLSSGIVTTLSTDFAPAHAGTAQFLGLCHLLILTAYAIGPLISALVIDRVTVAAASLVAAGLCAVAAAWMAFVVPETLHQPTVGSDGGGSGDGGDGDTALSGSAVAYTQAAGSSGSTMSPTREQIGRVDVELTRLAAVDVDAAE